MPRTYVPQWGYAYLYKEYHEKDRSLADIAKDHKTNANKIRRAIIYWGIRLKDKVAAQKSALASGRAKHPTEGRKRTENERQRIGDSYSKSYENRSLDFKERRSELARKNFESMDEAKLQEFRRKSAEAVRKTAQHGSKLEHSLATFLRDRGYKVSQHTQHKISSESMHFDLYLEDLMYAIEIDGPTHLRPVFGEAEYQKIRQKDSVKEGLTLAAGYGIIRVSYPKSVSETRLRQTCEKVLDIVKTLTPGEARLILVEGSN